MAENWITSHDDGMLFVIQDLDGISWIDRPAPRRMHCCTAVTKGFDRGMNIERCACGAIRMAKYRKLGPLDRWQERNTRTKGAA